MLSKGSLLTFIIPIYNEENTLSKLLDKVLLLKLPEGFSSELILVNDFSRDKSLEICREYESMYKNIKVLTNEKNLGKSQTVKRGILASEGDYVVIQDADLEYNPENIAEMLQLAMEKDLDVVYGDRFGKKNEVVYPQNYIGNKFLSLISNIFTYSSLGCWVPDMEVCYKLIRGEIARPLAKDLEATSNFGFEPEITARLARYSKNVKKLKMAIYPIEYYPRTISEGKKIRYSDGIKALKEIIKYRP